MSASVAEATRLCLRHSRLSSSPSAARKTFSSSCARRKHGPLAVFPPTSSPDLDAFLLQQRDAIFLPAHLARVHRDLIYRPTMQHYLTGEEPVEVELHTTASGTGKSKFTLSPLDHRAEPPKKASLARLLSLLEQTGDWAVLPEFLRELRVAERSLTRAIAGKIVRAAVRGGRLGVVLECLQRAEATGLRLDNAETSREVMWGCLQRATGVRWSEEEQQLSRALRNAELVLRMMQSPGHEPAMAAATTSTTLTQSVDDLPAHRPEIWAVPLALTAARAVFYTNGRDEDGKVAKYAAKVLENLQHADLGADVSKYWLANEALMLWAPVWHGGQLALRVLNTTSEHDAGSKLRDALERAVQPLIQRARATLDAETAARGEKRFRGQDLYDQLEDTIASPTIASAKAPAEESQPASSEVVAEI